MTGGETIVHEFVDSIPEAARQQCSLHLHRVRYRRAQVLLRMWPRGCHTLDPDRLGHDVRWRIDLTVTLDWELELPMPIPLHHPTGPRAVGGAVVDRGDRAGQGTRPQYQRPLLRRETKASSGPRRAHSAGPAKLAPAPRPVAHAIRKARWG